MEERRILLPKKKKIEIPNILRCPKNNMELHSYIKENFGLFIPNKIVVEGNKSPFDFLADIFFERVQNVIGIGSRGSGKTQMLGVLHPLNSVFKPKCETGTLGAIERQAKKCYSYIVKVLDIYRKNTSMIENVLMSETKFSNESKIAVLIATMTGVNSPHPHKAALDEFELVEWHIFQEFLQMAQESDGIKSQNILTSTRKFAYGTVERLLKQRKEMGFELYLWSVWESGAKCDLPNCNECKKIKKGKKADGSDRSFYDVCGEKLRRASGFISLRDIIGKFQTLDIETWKAQQECLKPSKTGSVFNWFDEEKHIKDFGISRSARFYEGIDWGGNDPHAWVLIMEYGGEFYIIDELFMSKCSPTKFLKKVLDKRDSLGFTGDTQITTYADSANLSAILEARDMGINAIGVKKGKDSIINGISMINSLGESNRIFIHRRCENLIKEFNQYHYQDGVMGGSTRKGEIPVSGGDHGIDAFRYVIFMLNPVNMVINETYEEEDYIDKDWKENYSSNALFNLGFDESREFDMFSISKSFDIF